MKIELHVDFLLHNSFGKYFSNLRNLEWYENQMSTECLKIFITKTPFASYYQKI